MYFHSTISLFCVTIIVSAKMEEDLILEYFSFKKVSSVIGYPCNTSEEDFRDHVSLVRRFNQYGISVSLFELNNRHAIYRSAHTNYWKVGVFLDFRCYDAKTVSSVLSGASEYRMYDDLHVWFIIGLNIRSVMNLIDDNSFSFTTDFVIAVPTSNNWVTSYRLFDVYNVGKKLGATFNSTVLGFWNERDKLHFISNETKFLKRRDFYGTTLRASFFNSKYKPPQMLLEDYLQNYASAPKDGLSKFGFIILSHLSEMFNFKLKCDVVAKWEAGDATGPIIRALISNETDITGSPATMNIERTYLVKYVHQSWPFRTCFIFRSPQPKNVKMSEIFDPFVTKVWCYVAFLFILGVWSIALVMRYEYNDTINMRYSDAFLITFGAMCQQGTDIKMNHISTRFTFLCILEFSFLIYNYYSASVVSVRLRESIFKLNDSLNELAKTDLRLASEWMTYFDLFMKSQDWETKSLYEKRWKFIPENEQFLEPERAMSLVKEGGFAYHSHPDVSYPFIKRLFTNRETCELTEVHLAHPTYSTFAVSLNSTFGEIIKIGITKIAEVGIRKRQELRWTSSKPVCQKNVLNASSVDIYEFAPHLFILLFGMIAASILYVLEISQSSQAVHRLMKILKKKTQKMLELMEFMHR